MSASAYMSALINSAWKHREQNLTDEVLRLKCVIRERERELIRLRMEILKHKQQQ